MYVFRNLLGVKKKQRSEEVRRKQDPDTENFEHYPLALNLKNM